MLRGDEDEREEKTWGRTMAAAGRGSLIIFKFNHPKIIIIIITIMIIQIMILSE